MRAYTGGKTGGHIMPLISLIDDKEEALYVGYSDELEELMCKKNNIKFLGMKKYSSKFKILKNYFELKKHLSNEKIDFVISTGGRTSLPLCLYSIFHKIPLYLIEENCVRGLSNLLFYPFCKKMFLAFPIKNIRKKEIITGLPVRFDNRFFLKEYDILIIGGSLGSKPLCDIGVRLSKNYKVCLICGRYYDEYKNYSFDTIRFSDDIYSFILKSKIVIARAGASTISEILYLNVAFICIPSKKTKRNHQVINALYFDKLNACKCIFEDDYDNILKYVSILLNDENKRIDMINNQRAIFKHDSKLKILKEINNG